MRSNGICTYSIGSHFGFILKEQTDSLNDLSDSYECRQADEKKHSYFTFFYLKIYFTIINVELVKGSDSASFLSITVT